MQKAGPISDFRIATDSGNKHRCGKVDGNTGTCVVRQAFADTTTWDEIISVLEEEALRKFAVAGR